jgi:tRNA(Ile)-lysidine synthase TilS/MesJ
MLTFSRSIVRLSDMSIRFGLEDCILKGRNRSQRICTRFLSNITSKRPIAIAMSGGVDSSVAALFLKNAGYEIFAIHMQNWDEEEEKGVHNEPGVCSSAQDLLDVKRTCRILDIPLHEV